MPNEQDSTFEELDTAASSTTADSGNDGNAGTDKAPVIQITSDADLAALRSLADMGITPANAADFVQAKASLDSVRTSLTTDPDVLLAQLQTANPDAYFKMLDKATERYLNHFPAPTEGGTAGKGGAGSTPQPDPAIVSQLTAVRQELDALKADRTNSANAARAKEIDTAYNERVDGLVKDAAEKAKLDARDQELLKFRVNASISKDPAARRHIMQGVYADIPAHFKSVLDAQATETKATSASNTAARAAVAAGGRTDPASGAAAADGTPVSSNPMDDWDNAADAFAAGLKSSQRK